MWDGRERALLEREWDRRQYLRRRDVALGALSLHSESAILLQYLKESPRRMVAIAHERLLGLDGLMKHWRWGHLNDPLEL